jgi:hypothetical protein
MTEAHLRAMEREDWAEVADLIYVSLNYWCEANGRPTLFRGGPEATTLFCEVYEGLDPGHCVVAEHPRTVSWARASTASARPTSRSGS